MEWTGVNSKGACQLGWGGGTHGRIPKHCRTDQVLASPFGGNSENIHIQREIKPILTERCQLAESLKEKGRATELCAEDIMRVRKDAGGNYDTGHTGGFPQSVEKPSQ